MNEGTLRNTFSKAERLCKRKDFELIFSQGAALLPGLNIQTELTDRIGVRYGANAGIYYAKTREPIFEQKNGVTTYDVYTDKNMYWIMLIDFSITIKITKNYLPHQR
ncbi:MAG TPA: hypothetical protein PKX86_05930 [Bacteroidia bacterium]|nr:hypothetical protein [Bacteroidia bacterium]